MILSAKVVILTTLASCAATAQTPEQTEFFEKQVRPLLAAKCQACHNQKVKTAGLDLSTGEGFVHGGQSGVLIAKEAPAESRLLKVVSYDERQKMPPTGKLKPAELETLANWVKLGALWPGAPTESAAPAEKPKTSGVRVNGMKLTDSDRGFWSFQPVKDQPPPKVKDQKWAKAAIDKFILAKLEEKGIRPASPASKTVLLRRATYDLTGLPPTEPEIKDFLADNSPAAFEKIVDRLLASPRYGEKWGRHWLDVARYADSTGNDEDHRYPYAFRYRDYVIESFNRDIPFNRFIREQIAGDLLPPPAGETVNRRGITATGFLAIGPKALAQQDKKKMIYDVYDEQVDVVSKAMLGITIACARCHDHKFDPIYTKDYYSLISIFASTRSFAAPGQGVSKLLFTPLVEKHLVDAYQAHQDKMNRKKSEMEQITEAETDRYNKETAPRTAEYMLAAFRVYKDGEKATEIAKQSNLNPDMLTKWAKLLGRDDKPPFLETWNESPKEKLSETAKAYQEKYEKTLGERSKELGRWRNRVAQALKKANMPPPEKPTFAAERDPFFHAVYFERGPFAITTREQEKMLTPEMRDKLAALRKEVEELKKNSPPEPELADTVAEGETVNQKVFLRGDYENPGEDAPKAFPLVLAKATDPAISQGSGRRELADWIASDGNPLTARVFVNRMWSWHFGDGLVRTPDNFGRMGERPANPELLDFLAARFIESGWSVKAMHRTMMLSSTYQLSSAGSADAESKDQENKLLSRFNRRRLDVEEIRDGMLSLDGTLDLTMGGTLQTGFGTDSENSNGRLSLNPEKLTRRSVYVPLRRSNLPTLLNLFDFGDATTPTGKRSLTNVAPQALFMMNSVFVNERAENLIKSLNSETDATRRLASAYLRILNRPPDGGEADNGLTYIESFKNKFPGPAAESTAWRSLYRVLLGSNEFIYVD